MNYEVHLYDMNDFLYLKYFAGSNTEKAYHYAQVHADILNTMSEFYVTGSKAIYTVKATSSKERQ